MSRIQKYYETMGRDDQDAYFDSSVYIKSAMGRDMDTSGARVAIHDSDYLSTFKPKKQKL